MCLLTVLPMPDLLGGKTIERLNNGADCNPHGSGWAVVQGDRIVTGRSLDAEEAVSGFVDAYIDATGPALFHSRWATHGEKTIANVHPFRVPKLGHGDTYVAHNGIMPVDALPGLKDHRTDTQVFADQILPVRYKRLDNFNVRNGLEHWLSGNKIAILTTNPRYARQLYVFGMGLGEWVDGVWYSNGDHAGWDKYWKHYAAASPNPESGPCYFCAEHAVNTWAICTSCGTCQDCFEHQDHCQCFIVTDNTSGKITHTGPLALEGQIEDPEEYPCVIGYDSATQTERSYGLNPDEADALREAERDPAYAAVAAELDDEEGGAVAALDEAQALHSEYEAALARQTGVSV